MIFPKKLNKLYLISAVFTIILFSSTINAKESNLNNLSISDRLLDNSSLILSCPISIANANIDEITEDTPKPNPKKPSALEYFEDAAICAKKERNINAMFNFVSAIMWIGVGIADKGEEPRHYYTYNQHGSSMGTYPEFDDSPTARTAYGLAGMYTLIGIGYITSSSPTESEYNRIMDSYNFSQRQEIANKSLKYIVNIEKKRRLS
ncbi:MAG: hypothetical protein GY865_17035, partial [candidate division Zixibacteria bacterium]|nr:hypothetical protein [candidate division Zixibacteria bacterium]